MKVRLAEALLRRKELQDKVQVLKAIDTKGLFELRVKRVNVADNLDEVTANVPKLKAEDVTRAYDWHAKQLRLVDAMIQQANWTTELEVPDSVMADYETPGGAK